MEAAAQTNKGNADAWSRRITAIVTKLRGEGVLTYAEQAAELNRRGERTRRGVLWTAQSVYLCCRRARGKGPRRNSRETHELVDGRWRHGLREKIVELRSYGVTRYADLAEALNKEGVTTRLGKRWATQSIKRLMRSVGLPTGKPGRRRKDE